MIKYFLNQERIEIKGMFSIYQMWRCGFVGKN